MLKGVVVTGNQEFLDSQLFKICLVLNDVKKGFARTKPCARLRIRIILFLSEQNTPGVFPVALCVLSPNIKITSFGDCISSVVSVNHLISLQVVNE
jgi:hypothetical protein